MGIRVILYLAAIGVGIGLVVWWLAKRADPSAREGEMFSPGDPSGGYVPPADTPGHGHM